jgi:BlaI family transcriptional regulator, penicillinase repressor
MYESMAEQLGPLEMQVLGLLSGAEPATVNQVRQRLSAAGADYAYTTVMTVLTRLYQKGVLRREKQGHRYVYRTTPGDRALKHGLLQRMRRALFTDRLAPLAALLDEDLTRVELLELRRMVDEQLRKK